MTETLRERITRHEGVVLTAYRDTVGKLTIGVGRNLDDNPFSPAEFAAIGHDGRSKPITLPQAMMLLDNDIARAQDSVTHVLPWVNILDEIRRGVLVEMVFQLGMTRVGQFVNFLKALQRGDYTNAAMEMLNSLWAKQTPRRVRELAGIMAKGET